MNDCDICGEDLLTGICCCSPEAILAWPQDPEEKEDN